MFLLADAELVDDGAVAREISLLQVVQEPAAATNELQQSASAVVVLRVRLEMLGQIGDPIREKRDLHLRGTGIAVMRGVRGNELRFLLLRRGQNPCLLKRLT